MSIPSAGMDPSPNPPSASAANTLFSAEEAKFLTESLSSAESFDPFTIGAPGFKVPNLIPPNIAANQVDHLHHLQHHQHQHHQHHHLHPHHQQQPHFSRSMPNNSIWPPSSSVATSTAPLTTTPPTSLLLSTQTDAGLHFPFTGPPGSSLDLRAIADSMRIKASETSAVLSGLSHLSTPSTSTNASNEQPYSTHRVSSWSMYGPRGTPPSHQELPPSTTTTTTTTTSSSSSSSNTTTTNNTDRRDATSAGYGNNRAWQLEQLSFLEAQANAVTRRNLQHQGANKSDHRNSADLSMLGANFPSSHSFPAHDQLNQSSSSVPSQLQSMIMSDPGMARVGASQPNGNTATNNDAHTTPTSAGKRMWGSFSGEKRAADGSPVEPASASSLGRYGSVLDAKSRGRSPNANANANANARPAWAASSSTPPGTRSDSNANGINTRRSDPNAALMSAMGDLAHLELDLDAASQRLPATLTEYFAPALSEKRIQPHLDLLRQEHFESGLIDGNGKEINKGASAEEKETKKQGHVLLTEAEKKANHIASEQKRRANIRKGYELLCEIVPPLKEALEREARKEKERASDDEDEADKKKGKKKRDADTSTGCEIDGEKIDGRAGPRSEAVVLMKSLEHIGSLVERHRALLGRRNRARLALAKLHGVDLGQNSHRDVDAELGAKLSAAANSTAMIQD